MSKDVVNEVRAGRTTRFCNLQSELESQRAVLAYLMGCKQLTGRRLQQEADAEG